MFSPVQPAEHNKGRKICAWCCKDLVALDVEGISHGMCEECSKEFIAEGDQSDRPREEDEIILPDKPSEKE